MMEFSRWKIWLVGIIAGLGVLFTLPNFLPEGLRSQIPGFLPSQILNLGLDLQGGSYLLLEVDTQALIKEKYNNLTEDVRTKLKEKAIAYSALNRVGDHISVRISDAAQLDQAYGILNTLSVPLPKNPGVHDINIAKGADQTITLTLSPETIVADSVDAVQTDMETVRKRVDSLGTKEPSILRQGTNRIDVEAPGQSDAEQLKRVRGQTAKLTFQMVDESASPADVAADLIPPGSEVLPYAETKYGKATLLVRKRILVSGDDLTNAGVGQDQSQRPAIEFRFNGLGAKRFGDATAQNIGKRFAIILDGKVVSAPTINSAITGGSGIIEGSFTYQSASELAGILKSGALRAPLKIEEQRTVTAELGADSVQKGALATMIALVSVLIFVLLAYGFLFGGVSVIALLVNMVLLIGGMSMMQSTLTLPGIAGLILTLAMAVDANVLIYERMREEARAGRSVIQAMDIGFSRAFVTIFDANLTGLIAAVIMIALGAGPVRGFAVTLLMGIFTSVFSSVMVTQVLLSSWYRMARPKTLPIL